MKKIHLILACLSLAMASNVNTFAQSNYIAYNGIVAYVNGDIITESDLEERVRLVMLSTGKNFSKNMLDKIKSNLLHEMIDELLRRQLAHKYVMYTPDKRFVTIEEIDDAIADILSNNNMNRQQFSALLKKHHVSEKCFRTQIATRMIWMNFIKMRYGNAVNVSENELKQCRNEYNKRKNEMMYHVQKIVFPVSNKKQDHIALSKINTVTALMNENVAFEELARQFSEDASAQKGGDIGFVFADQLSNEECVAIKKLEIGHTAVIKSNRGYVILKLKSKRISNADHVTKVKLAQIALPLNQGYTRAQVEEYLNELKKQYPTASALVKGAKGKAYVSEPEIVATDNLNPEYAKIIGKMKPGNVSKNYEMNGALMVLCLLDEIQEKVQPITDQMLKNQKIGEKLSKFSDLAMQQQKQSSTVVINNYKDKN